jgi:DNA mismatch repair protein MSH6
MVSLRHYFPLTNCYSKAFKKLSRGLSKLADESESFKSKTILGLLRSAPDLLPNIKNVEAMYVRPSSDKGDCYDIMFACCLYALHFTDDELLPQAGKDDAYDEIMAEIGGLEEDLEKELKKLEKKLGCDLLLLLFARWF